MRVAFPCCSDMCMQLIANLKTNDKLAGSHAEHQSRIPLYRMAACGCVDPLILNHVSR